ncbi:MAG: hypothetical protein ACRYFV_13415, partial [Janthinobacterium lividum]
MSYNGENLESHEVESLKRYQAAQQQTVYRKVVPSALMNDRQQYEPPVLPNWEKQLTMQAYA